MKTSDLTGALLDYWVARAEGVSADHLRIWNNISGGPRVVQTIPGVERGTTWNASTDWAQAGPIIQRERIKLMPTIPTAKTWYSSIFVGETWLMELAIVLRLTICL